ncbi:MULTISPECIES: alpha/beta hydrolase [Stenotrophomonas]|uniref:alpha/beta hydrolase n=1 Tax=Stenotrophomonas TaxID=40323 RepID=UPI00066C2872|nr:MULTISPECIES: alpha/beta hydrolase [Stenotrophomonas]MBA0355620.1 alpha/beta hydrolase [Stenotrophomonas maltophilia]MBH1694025.1 alpha/beta hydrolase [Stenotrophomonas maltophilia]MDG2510203.1 alpha/beta hydrolase [Stenotrophomonas maltophilia]MDH0550989.1 alpha/beta hydrolase [Stenotrophomonas sp. GD04006]PJL48502.1 esterase [Stenotrophomonas maltophilia]
MLLEPALQQFVDAVAAHALPEDLRELRAISENALPQLQGAPQPVAHVIEHTVIARDGHALELRFYTPEGLPDGPVPALLFAHGGGWFQCSLAVYDGPCRALANASGCVVVAVGYRLAPEHPFPVPLHDVADAWQWLQINAAGLGLDLQRLAIGGDSAGGNLAAACCLLLRVLGLPQPRHQLLLYPALDAGMGSDSYREYASGYYLSAELMQRCWQAYLGGMDLDPPPALASPAHASNLQGLAPASVLSCEHDPLRDEAEQYAHRLQAAGVDCTLERLPGMIHACIHLQDVAVSSGMAVQRAGDLLRQALA